MHSDTGMSSVVDIWATGPFLCNLLGYRASHDKVTDVAHNELFSNF
jgi:hypothetical protein